MIDAAGPAGAAVVWGRTAAADQWWRRVPQDPTWGRWVRELTEVTVAEQVDGNGSTCLVGRRGTTLLVGVHVLASRLSGAYGRLGDREFGVFVGWLADSPPTIPTCSALRDHAVAWAAPLWERVAADDWGLDVTAAAPRAGEVVPLPWLGEAATLAVQSGAVLSAVPAPRLTQVWAVPEAEADAVVAARLRANADFAVVVGLQRAPRNLPAGLSDLALIGLESAMELSRSDNEVEVRPTSSDAERSHRTGGLRRKLEGLFRPSASPVAVLRASVLVNDGRFALLAVDETTGEPRLPGRELAMGELPSAVADAEVRSLGRRDARLRLHGEQSEVRDGIAHVELIYAADVVDLEQPRSTAYAVVPLSEVARLLQWGAAVDVG